MNKKHVNPDLLRERKNCTLNIEELTNFLDEGPEKTAERRKIEKYFLDDPEFKYKTPLEYLSHKEKLEVAVQKSCALLKKLRALQEQCNGDLELLELLMGARLGPALLKDGNPLNLHYVMFTTALMDQADDEQSEWVRKAYNVEIIGSYAQTELGHGTFVRGLETTATYEPSTEEFIINSPTITSFKWWPAGLGHVSNYAIVMAQLYIEKKCHGIHAFLVQLRDEESHHPLPGIQIGEVGAKLGLNCLNNGYVGFENVRIPRKNMLMKYNKVLKDGTYIKNSNKKSAYGTMILIRTYIVNEASIYLQKAVTIATRYSAVRRQSELVKGEPEPQILDFVTQQYKLFPQLATSLAYLYSAQSLKNLYENIKSEIERGELERLPELHAMTCCLKAMSTSDAAQGVEICRLACGGHGYMTSSNLPSTYNSVTATCLFEGDNTILLLQTAWFLMKSYKSALEGKKLTPAVQYLEDYKNISTIPFMKSIVWIINALQMMAISKIKKAYYNLENRIKRGQIPEKAWNETSIELCAASVAHCRVLVVETYYNAMLERCQNVSPNLKVALFKLTDLYAVHIALLHSGDLLRFSNVFGADIEELQSWLEELLVAIRINCIGIVDGLDLSDDILSSTLGAYDGNVYERLFAEAKKSPLNSELVNKSFKDLIKPFIKSNI